MLLPKVATQLVLSNAPKAIRFAHGILPMSIQDRLIMPLVHRLSKEFLELGDLDFMDGKVARLTVSDIDLNWYFSKKPDKPIELIKTQTDLEYDVMFMGDTESMILMASHSVDPDTLFFSRKLSIQGDTELGLEIKNLIDRFELENLPSPIKQGLDYWARHILKEHENNARSSLSIN